MSNKTSFKSSQQFDQETQNYLDQKMSFFEKWGIVIIILIIFIAAFLMNLVHPQLLCRLIQP